MATEGTKAALVTGAARGIGLATATLLHERGWLVDVYLYGKPSDLPPDAKQNMERWQEHGPVNNLLEDCPTIPEPFGVDFTTHATSMGATAEKVANPAELAEAFKRAKASDKTYVIVMDVDAYEGWTTEGHAWWEVGTPHTSADENVRNAHVEWETTREKQRKGI